MRSPLPTGRGAGGRGAQTPPLRTECGAHSCPAPARNGTTPRRGTQPRQPERQRNTPGQPRQASPRACTRRNSAGAGRKKRGRKPPHSPGAWSARPPEARRASAPGGTRQPTRRTQGEPAPERAPTPREGGANGGRANPRTSGGSTPRRKGGEPAAPKNQAWRACSGATRHSPRPTAGGTGGKAGGQGRKGATGAAAAARSAGREGESATGTDQESGLAAPRHGTTQTPRQGAKWRKGRGTDAPPHQPQTTEGGAAERGTQRPPPSGGYRRGSGRLRPGGRGRGAGCPPGRTRAPPARTRDGRENPRPAKQDGGSVLAGGVWGAQLSHARPQQ